MWLPLSWRSELQPVEFRDHIGVPAIRHRRRQRLLLNSLRDLGPGDYLAFRAAGPHSYEAVDGPVRSVLLLEYPPDVYPTAAGGPHLPV